MCRVEIKGQFLEVSSVLHSRLCGSNSGNQACLVYVLIHLRRNLFNVVHKMCKGSRQGHGRVILITVLYINDQLALRSKSLHTAVKTNLTTVLNLTLQTGSVIMSLREGNQHICYCSERVKCPHLTEPVLATCIKSSNIHTN